MTLNFPNLSRSYEARQNRVRFWGYDSAREITFFSLSPFVLASRPKP